MIAYASRTGTRRNLAALREAGWHLLVSAKGCLRSEGFPYALDNGAWTAFQSGQPFDETAFLVALDRMGGGAEWTVVPDIVAGGRASLEFSMSWLERVLDGCSRALVAVQDGIEPGDVRDLLSERIGLFVGGSTEWKLATMGTWCRLASEVGCWAHVGRVNTKRRIAQCASVGATSFDGTSGTRFAVNIPMLDEARRQLSLPVG